MLRFFVKAAVNAVALWLTTLILTSEHLEVIPFEPRDQWWTTVLTYGLIAIVFGIVNGIIGNAIRIIAFPLYILTLGLVALIVNGLLLWLVVWISGLVNFGLFVHGNFWWGVLAALILGVISWFLGLFARPLTKREGRSR